MTTREALILALISVSGILILWLHLLGTTMGWW